MITVATAEQQQTINGLAQYIVSELNYNRKLCYEFSTATKEKICAGNQKQFNAYKNAFAAQQASQPVQLGKQLINPPPTFAYEGARPEHIEVEQSDGFGPMGTASFGDCQEEYSRLWGSDRMAAGPRHPGPAKGESR